MMRAIATAVIVAVAALATGRDLEEDAGPVRSETRTLERFDRIEVNGRTEMKVRVGGRQSVTLRGGEDLLAEVDVEEADERPRAGARAPALVGRVGGGGRDSHRRIRAGRGNPGRPVRAIPDGAERVTLRHRDCG